MIVKMKKATMLCLPSDKESALDKLRDLGVMHVEIDERVDTEEVNTLTNRIEFIDHAVALLKTRVSDHKPKEPYLTGEQLCDVVNEITELDAALKKQMDALIRDRDRLAPWGDFDQATVPELREKGVYMYLCAGVDKDIEALPKSIVRKDFHTAHETHRYFAVIAHAPLDESKLPLAVIPEDVTYSYVLKEISRIEKEIQTNEDRLDKLVHYEQVALDYQLELHQKLEFVTNRDAMTSVKTVDYIKGFVPVTEVDALTDAAKANGWGLQIVEPANDDEVPTYVKVPKLFSISKPIFDFMGISPGYHEVDCSAVFLMFFTTFFAMIIGDGGYGMLFLAAAIGCKLKFGGNREAKLPINLFMLLSIATIVWGFLTGNFFGLVNSEAAALAGNFQWPAFMTGLGWFKSDQNIQFLCFGIAVTHLSIAHGWSAICKINSPQAVGEIGWLLLIVGAFFVICDMVVGMPIIAMLTAAKFLILPGVILMLLFSVNWKDIGDILNFPFGVMGGFIDSLSYIRLFAVGLAGYQVAKSFNNMGIGIIEMETIVGYVGGSLIIIMGHALNIALCVMGVLVHGIRLNTLEFSGHLNLEWAGFAFKPFKKLIETESK